MLKNITKSKLIILKSKLNINGKTFIENNMIKIANKIKAKYKKKLLYLKRHFKMLRHMYNQNKILNLSLEFFNSSRFFGKYLYLWNEELNLYHGDPRTVTLSWYCTCCIRPRGHWYTDKPMLKWVFNSNFDSDDLWD